MEEVGQHDALIPYRQAAKQIIYVTSGTVPLQIIKAVFPITTALILSRSEEVAVRQSAVLISSCLDLTDIINSPLHYVTTMVGQLHSTPEGRENIGQAAQAGWLLAVILSVPQGLLLFFSKPILILFGQNDSVSEVVKNFFHACLWSMPLHNLQLTSEGVALGLGTKRIYFPVIVQVCALAVFGLMAYPLAFGVWGAPNFGVSGVAYARLARGGTYTILTVGGFLLLDRNLFRFKREGFLKRLGELCFQSLIVFVIVLSEVGVVYTNNILVGKSNTNFLMSQLIISQYQDFLLVFTSAIGSSAQSEISRNINLGKKNIFRLGNVGLALSFVMPLIFMGLSLGCPTLLMRPFTDPAIDQNAVNILVDHKLLLVSAFNNLLLASRYVLTMALIGMGHLDFFLVANVMLTWVGLGVGAAVAFGADADGILSLNLGLGLGFLISAIAQTINWVRKTRVNVDVRPTVDLLPENNPGPLSIQQASEVTPDELSLSEIEDESRLTKSVEILTSSTYQSFFARSSDDEKGEKEENKQEEEKKESTSLLKSQQGNRFSRCVIC